MRVKERIRQRGMKLSWKKNDCRICCMRLNWRLVPQNETGQQQAFQDKGHRDTLNRMRQLLGRQRKEEDY